MSERANHQRKVVSRTDLLTAVHTHRTAGRTIVQCHGCFDIVHPGHIRYLEFASRQGDVLIVTLTGDSEIDKGPQRPYIPQELRAESVAALEFVDYVHIDPAATAEAALAEIRPDVYVKGREYETSHDPRFQRERAVVEAAGGRVIFSSGDVVFSSSALISALPRDEQLAQERLAIVCARHEINAASIHAICSRFSGLRVGVIGDVILDRYVFCDAHDVASESPMLALTELEQREYVGGAAIVARHAAALGAEPYLLTTLAEDTASERALGVLAEEGVSVNALRTRPSLVEKTRYLVDENKVLKVQSGLTAPLDSRAEREAARLLSERARDLDALIVCDFGYGTVTAALLERVLPTLRANIPILSADVSGSRGNLLNYRQVDLLCPTERELRHTLHDFDEGLSSVAYRLMSATQARHLLCTLDKHGLVVFERPGQNPLEPAWASRLQSEHFPAFGVRCLDRLGCGDALLATATMALAAGGSLVQAAYLGNAAAAIEIGHLGNVPVASDMLACWLHQRAELARGPRMAAPAVTLSSL